jgi:hypothetical protein
MNISPGSRSKGRLGHAALRSTFPFPAATLEKNVFSLFRFLVASLFTLLTVQTASAGRVITFEILVEGNPVLVATTMDRGENDPDQVWAKLKELEFHNPAERFVLSEKETVRLRAFHEDLAT